MGMDETRRCLRSATSPIISSNHYISYPISPAIAEILEPAGWVVGVERTRSALQVQLRLCSGWITATELAAAIFVWCFRLLSMLTYPRTHSGRCKSFLAVSPWYLLCSSSARHSGTWLELGAWEPSTESRLNVTKRLQLRGICLLFRGGLNRTRKRPSMLAILCIIISVSARQTDP